MRIVLESASRSRYPRECPGMMAAGWIVGGEDEATVSVRSGADFRLDGRVVNE